ncbi:MAG: MBL fold metallo-hydrolase [Bacillota bacterium]|nr:MBL fold metallo-hydrolase [Bacillota bacterium]
MECIKILPLSFRSEGEKARIYPAVLKDANGLTLVDCGCPQHLPEIEKVMEQAGLKINEIVRIIITHHDYDHMGALKEITEKYGGIEVFCSEAQKPFVTGKAKSLRLIQAEEKEKYLTDAQKKESKVFMDMLKSVKTVDSASSVNSGDILPVCGGLQVIDTSGHMPGHISLYSIREKTLIAGDALSIYNGKLNIPHPEYTMDMPMALKSIEKLINLDIEKIICYHGGIYADSANNIRSDFEKIVSNNRA